MRFSHLHLHSLYSLLDGAIKLDELLAAAASDGMTSVAVTDHGNMFGVVDFYTKAQKAGIKPILGCETYIVPHGKTHDDKTSRKSHHLVLLAENEIGYRNLTKLVSKAYLQGFYYYPRIDHDLLREHSEGLIGLTACLGGEIPQRLLNDEMDEARRLAEIYRGTLGKDNFFLEVQDNGLPEQTKVNDAIFELGKDMDIPIVATNDCHYLKREDAEAHDILLCIQTGKTRDDPSRMRYGTDAFYFKTAEEMARPFHDHPEVIERAGLIADRCNVKLTLGEVYLPKYGVPEGYDLDGYLVEVATKGLEARFKELAAGGWKVDQDEYKARLKIELEVIISMGFSGYFLIVWDFINYAKSVRIPVGPGRGSGAGSLVAYSLRITDIEPIRYNLLFERFLNPERVSMPDFDIDFCMNRRDEVIKYVTNKYGEMNVGQIVTFGSLKARGVIRDVGRVMSLSYGEVDKIAKLVPEEPGMTMTKAFAREPKLQEVMEENPTYKELLTIAKALEGLNRHMGMHAAGIVIGDKPLWDYVPLCKGANDEIVTQFAKEEVEKAGLVKFDFLGLKTLTVIDDAVHFVEATTGEPLDISAIPIDDEATYQLISRGDTVGVFQLESSGFQSLLKKLKPDCFEDIVAAVALYRPGPLGSGMVDDFVRRKHGLIKVEYPMPELETILKDTYGVIVYQEQVMQIASRVAGFSLGQADILRRAMGKKKAEVMEAQKAVFLDGAEARGFDRKKAEDLFHLIEQFAQYGFNKSHSAAYALITYQTGYLKTHHPTEFMAALLSADKDNTDKVVNNITEARQMGITIAPPDVNESGRDFTVVEAGVIRFGLGAIKNVGMGAVDLIIAAREEEPFTSLGDFAERVDTKKVNKRVMEALIKAGAFDFTGKPRHILFARIDAVVDRAQRLQADKESGQMNMFDALLAPPAPKEEAPPIDFDDDPKIPPWTEWERLTNEKECLGFYITGHPLDRFANEIKRYTSATTQTISKLGNRDEFALAGVVSALRVVSMKNGGGRMAYATIEDQLGTVEALVFKKTYEEYEEVLASSQSLLLKGYVKVEGSDEEGFKRKLVPEEIMPLSSARESRTSRVELRLEADRMSDHKIQRIAKAFREFPGDCPVRFKVQVPTYGTIVLSTPPVLRVRPCNELAEHLERIVGKNMVFFL